MVTFKTFKIYKTPFPKIYELHRDHMKNIRLVLVVACYFNLQI